MGYYQSCLPHQETEVARYDYGGGVIRLIVSGGGQNKLRFELIRRGRCIRCSKFHSSGSGVRPDTPPVDNDLMYIIHGACLEAAHCISMQGSRKGDRLHLHLYECAGDGHVLGGVDRKLI